MSVLKSSGRCKCFERLLEIVSRKTEEGMRLRWANRKTPHRHWKVGGSGVPIRGRGSSGLTFDNATAKSAIHSIRWIPDLRNGKSDQKSPVSTWADLRELRRKPKTPIQGLDLYLWRHYATAPLGESQYGKYPICRHATL